MYLFVVNIANAGIKNNLFKPESQIGDNLLSFSFVSNLLVWGAALVGITGLLMLATAFFLYLLAAGEEPKMKKANTVLWGGTIFLLGGAVLYAIGRWVK